MSQKPEVTFVNALAVTGFLNGVVNLTFTTARWSLLESNDGPVVVPDEYVSLFLRMDLHCAQQVYDALGKIIAQNTKPEMSH